MLQNREEQLIRQTVVLLSREIGEQNYPEVQQREMQGPAPREE